MSELRLRGKSINERYQVRGKISSGSYAEVFVARDLEDDEELVIKALNTQLQGVPDFEFEETLIENFDHEATILESLRYPPSVALLDRGEAVDSQALERSQPCLPLKKGRCGTMTHDYKRHGKTTLFAELNILDGTRRRLKSAASRFIFSTRKLNIRPECPSKARTKPTELCRLNSEGYTTLPGSDEKLPDRRYHRRHSRP